MPAGTNVVNGVHGTVVGNVMQAGSLTVLEAVAAKPALNGLPDQPVFVGRSDQVEALLGLLRPDAGTRIAAVDGLGGIGKTALVVHVAKLARAAAWFPGGELMIDMRGYETDEQQVTAFAALGSLLIALGVHRDQIPDELAGRSALWRTLLAEHDGAERRILVVIDNASSPDQVVPLLPGASEHRVLVTSRHRLAGLPGTRLLTLPTLPEESATTLLALELDTADGTDERVRADLAATADLVKLCGGLPLALRTASMLLKADPAKSARDLVAALEDEHHRLEELEYEGNVSVRAAFNLSYRQLADGDRRALRLLAVNRGPAVSSEAAACLMNCEPRAGRRVLERLQRASLLGKNSHGLWQMHDLLRLYAAELVDHDPERSDAANRLLEHYVREVRVSAQHIDPRVPPSRRSHRFGSRAEAVAWTDVEYPNLLAAVALAEEQGADEFLRDLAIALDPYFDLRRQAQDWMSVAGAAVRACLRLNDVAGETNSRTSLGNACELAGDVWRALAEHERVLELSRESGDRYMESSALSNIGNAHRSMGNFERAIQYYLESLGIRRELGDRLGEGRTLTNLGIAYRKRGQSAEAHDTLRDSLATTIDYYERDLSISRELGDSRAEIITLCQLGHANRELGRLDEAARHYERAQEVSRRLDDRVGLQVAADSLLDLLDGRREEDVEEHTFEISPYCGPRVLIDPTDPLDDERKP